jgi:hypothetical protein
VELPLELPMEPVLLPEPELPMLLPDPELPLLPPVPELPLLLPERDVSFAPAPPLLLPPLPPLLVAPPSVLPPPLVAPLLAPPPAPPPAPEDWALASAAARAKPSAAVERTIANLVMIAFPRTTREIAHMELTTIKLVRALLISDLLCKWPLA